METKPIELSKIIPNPNNPRTVKSEDFEKLVQSIKADPEILTVNPIVLNSSTDFSIIAGQMRYLALKKLKYKKLPPEWILFADKLTEEQKKKFIILDNTHTGTWDLAKLNDDWADQLAEWNISIPEFNPTEELPDLLPVEKTEIKKEVTGKALATANEYSVFELVMLHENKLKLLEILNKIKNEQQFEKLEDSLMFIINPLT